MDNNFNGQQQPVYQAQPQQPVYQAQPQQPVYQAQPQQAPQQPVYGQAPSPVYQPQQAPKKPSNLNVLALVALICAGVGALFAFLGTTLMCACSAGAVNIKGETVENWNGDIFLKDMQIKFSTHPILVLAIIGGVAAIAAVVLAIIALKKKDDKVKGEKMAWVAIVVGLFATMYAFLPTFTICGYNCALDGAVKEDAEAIFDGDIDLKDAVEDLLD